MTDHQHAAALAQAIAAIIDCAECENGTISDGCMNAARVSLENWQRHTAPPPKQPALL